MDHDAYENHMIETINQHGEKTTTETVKTKFMNKDDVRVVTMGLKRTLLALLTAAMLAGAVMGFIAVTKVSGYMAVLVFFASVLALIGSFIFLCAQGITRAESRGESK